MEQINSSEEPAVNADQEHQKPQSWLASYISNSCTPDTDI